MLLSAPYYYCYHDLKSASFAKDKENQKDPKDFLSLSSSI